MACLWHVTCSFTSNVSRSTVKISLSMVPTKTVVCSSSSDVGAASTLVDFSCRTHKKHTSLGHKVRVHFTLIMHIIWWLAEQQEWIKKCPPPGIRRYNIHPLPHQTLHVSMSKGHAMKACRDSGGESPCILNLCTRWRWMVTCNLGSSVGSKAGLYILPVPRTEP
jgi:hypothetical protein